jgi:hypothetical protein
MALVAAAWLWQAREERKDERELDEGLADLRKDARGRDRAKFVRVAEKRAKDHEEFARHQVFQPPAGTDPGELDAVEAVDAFTGVMDELELAIEEERVLSEAESAELYERATGSFKAMSAWVDGGDPRERRLLEDSHQRMLDLMRKLDIRPPERQIDGFVSARDR